MMQSPAPNLAERALLVVPATAQSCEPFGVFLGTEINGPGMPIPYYLPSVREGAALPFICSGPTVLRAARIEERSSEVIWLERHLRVSQLFVGLGSDAFIVVVGRPTHGRGLDVPDLNELAALKVPGGHGLLLHPGTWHEFPMAWDEAVTILTLNSEEVVETLMRADEPRELAEGDVLKVHVGSRLGARVVVRRT